MANKKAQNQVSKDTLRKKLTEDVSEFLKRGGKIEQIETGRSGVDALTPRSKHIKIGKDSDKSS